MSEFLAGLTFEPAAPAQVLLAKLRKAQAPNGLTSMGEKFAMVVLSKTQAELRQMVDKLERDSKVDGDDAGNHMVDAILAASESLKIRLQLVDAAFARLCVVVDDLAVADKAKGGDDCLSPSSPGNLQRGPKARRPISHVCHSLSSEACVRA